MRSRKTNKRSALAQAMAWLERREYFPEELRTRLISKGYPEAEAELAITTLVEKRLLSESRALEAKLHQRSGKGAVGRARLMGELEQLGAMIEAIPEATLDDPAERRRAAELLEKKYPKGATRQQAGRFLYSRGFDEETIDAVLERFDAS